MIDEESKSGAEAHVTPPPNDEPASRYSKSAQWTIVVIVALAGYLRSVDTSDIAGRAQPPSSPLPASIYFPAIPALAKAFEESTENINLVVTIYLVFQGVCTND